MTQQPRRSRVTADEVIEDLVTGLGLSYVDAIAAAEREAAPYLEAAGRLRRALGETDRAAT